MITDEDVKKRQKIERRILTHCVKELLANDRNFYLGLNDGEETVVKHSRDIAAILKAAFSTDEDCLLIYLIGGDGEPKERHTGWIQFVYGNSGWDVIADYTTWLEPHIAKTEALLPKAWS